MNPGKTVSSGKGYTRSYTFNDEETLRTAQQSPMDARDAQSDGQRHNGFQGDSVVSYISHFGTTSVVIDYMHGALMGVTHRHLNMSV